MANNNNTLKNKALRLSREAQLKFKAHKKLSMDKVRVKPQRCPVKRTLPTKKKLIKKFGNCDAKRENHFVAHGRFEGGRAALRTGLQRIIGERKKCNNKKMSNYGQKQLDNKRGSLRLRGGTTGNRSKNMTLNNFKSKNIPPSRRVRVYGNVTQKAKVSAIKPGRKSGLRRQHSALGSSLGYRSEADIDMLPQTQSPVLYIVEDQDEDVKAKGKGKKKFQPQGKLDEQIRNQKKFHNNTAVKRQAGGGRHTYGKVYGRLLANETKPKHGTSKITFFYNMGQKHKKSVKTGATTKSKPKKLVFSKKLNNPSPKCGTMSKRKFDDQSDDDIVVPLTMHIPIIDIEPTAKDLGRDTNKKDNKKPLKFSKVMQKGRQQLH